MAKDFLLEEKFPCIYGLSYFFLVGNLIIATTMVAVGYHYQYQYLYILDHVSQSLTQTFTGLPAPMEQPTGFTLLGSVSWSPTVSLTDS